jgi:lipopolysaccharide transport system ATP-binding protein
MGSDVVIRAERLGKMYRIGHLAQPQGYVTLREVLARTARDIGRSATDLLRGRPMLAGDVAEDFWALNDLSFEVARGDVLGIVGRNGAGKSTLLKILSRITEPSKGKVTIAGRVASLLEVGTGFHPELTGRENIYLNGAILGMSHREVRTKFDEIVAFAEVENFLDTPVKRYSSGMYVRLAFAVAAHLEPEILIVDEVLAVGDFQFQQKCLGKMSEVANEGRTILFVSHNLAALANLCSRCVVLDHGALVADTDPAAGINQYLSVAAPPTDTYYRAGHLDPQQPAQLVEAEIHHSGDNPASTIKFRQALSIQMKWVFSARSPGFTIVLRFYDSLGRFITTANTTNLSLRPADDGSLDVTCHLENRFCPGTYHVEIGCFIWPHTMLADFVRCLSFVVSNVGDADTFKLAKDGLFSALAHWTEP